MRVPVCAVQGTPTSCIGQSHTIPTHWAPAGVNALIQEPVEHVAVESQGLHVRQSLTGHHAYFVITAQQRIFPNCLSNSKRVAATSACIHPQWTCVSQDPQQ
mgnify:CR=1 FL=1